MKPSIPLFTRALAAAAAVALSACGGGGGSAINAALPMTPVTTTVMDGLIQNALVCVDSNNNDNCDSGEIQGRTDAKGQVTLSIPTADLGSAQLLAVIGTDAVDADTGPVTTAYTMKNPAGQHAVISPLTNMVRTKMRKDQALGTETTVAQAETYVQAQTGLEVSVMDDFISKRVVDEKYNTAGKVARLLVESKQESRKAAESTADCEKPGKSREAERRHEKEIDDHLADKLHEINDRVNEVKRSCTSANGVSGCEKDYKEHALIVSSCQTPAKTAQTITFAAPADQVLGGSPVALVASASSGLALTWSTPNPTFCTVAAAQVTLVSPGTCTVTADQTGNTSFSAAVSASRSFTITAPVTASAQTITFNAPGTQTIGMAPPTLSATASSGLAVQFASTTASVCTVSADVLTLVSPGTCNITASQSGSASFAAATPLTGSFSVLAAPSLLAQTLAFDAMPGQTMGTTPAALIATSSAGLGVTFTSSTTAVCTVNGSILSLVSAGTCSISASQAGSSSYAAASPVVRSFTVAPVQTVVVSAANGKVLYNQAAGQLGMSCAACHSSAPARNISKVLRGANSATIILNAINGDVGGMGMFRSAYTTAQLNDIAAYLASPNL